MDAEARFQAEHDRFQRIIENTDAAYFRIGMNGCFEDVNPAWLRMYGFTRREDAIGLHFSAVQVPEDVAKAESIVEALVRGESVKSGEFSRLRRDGTIGYHSFSANPVLDGDRVIGIEGFLVDITERRRAEEAVRESEEHFRSLFENMREGVACCKMLFDGDEPQDFVYQSVNAAFEQLTGLKDVAGRRVSEVIPGIRESNPELFAIYGRVTLTGKPEKFETYVEPLDIWFSVSVYSPQAEHFVAVFDNITERKRAETAKAKLEEQLRQAQKLESLGRLAGGVAHDFNNLLTVINGYNGFLLNQLKAFDPLRSYAEEIKNAGERAASLTKQLLAFGRKQIIEPRTFDLNTTIRESAAMFQRLIGEDIALETHLDDSLGQVMADPHQIHQVVMNLVVNARDAMPDGGTLDIATMRADFGAEDSAAIHPDASPGRYVLMSVTDNGHGMDETTRQHVFEPFFTTKEVGKGTGLGLSTVYGIVRQSGGWIDVWSEVGVGTSFKVYLPRIDGSPVPERNGVGVPTERGSETILVVEDQKAVRSFTKAALRQYGYRVIEASGGDEAIAVARQYSGEIQLLLTDVVLPGMNGKELSGKLKALRPNLKVLFVSGYTADVIARRGVLDPGVAFLHKPFSPGELATRIRDVLGPAQK